VIYLVGVGIWLLIDPTKPVAAAEVHATDGSNTSTAGARTSSGASSS